MTKIGEEMYNALCDRCRWTLEDLSKEDISEITTEIAKKYIEKAWRDRINIYWESPEEYAHHKTDIGRFNQWLKSNGITE